MIRLSYDTLLTVQALHDYFADGRCRDISFDPVPSARELLAAYGMLSRQEGGRLTILLNNELRTELVEHLEKEGSIPLTFWMNANDPSFLSYTDWESAKLSGHAYNLDDANGSLTTDAKAYVAAENLVPLESLSAVPPRRMKQPVALITVHITKAMGNGNAPAPNFAVRFNSRRSVWKYFIMPGRSPFPSDMAVTGKKLKDAENFAGPDMVLLPNGEQAALFTSGQPIALSEKPTVIFQLRKHFVPEQKNGEMLLENLPTPGPDRIGFDRKTGEFVSEIYITL